LPSHIFVYIYTQKLGDKAHKGRAEARPIEHKVCGRVSAAVLDEAGRMERNSRKLIRMLEQDGWVLDRVNGDHHTFKHPEREAIITVTHPRRDLPTGLVRRIYKLAGWRP
jgi:predicted RNA binding protein YcfA (HicA-like mRNA interferase family)